MTGTSSHLHPIDWAVLVGYFTGMMAVGFHFYRRSRSVDGFTVANRSLPGWLCGFSIFATFLSSISFLALPGKSFAADWNPFVFSLSLPLATCIAARWFLPYYRRQGMISAYAALETRFGLWARIYASVFYLLTQIARIGVVMYLMALPLQVIFGWNIYTVLVVTGFCVTVYSFSGGITAVIWTDAIQALVLMAGAVMSLFIMLEAVPGGFGEVIAVAAGDDKLSLGSLGPSLVTPTLWVVLAYGIVINLQNFGIDQGYIQRYIAADTEREARRGLWLGGLLYVPVSVLFLLIGTTLFVQYGGSRTALPATVQPGKSVAAGRDLDEVRAIVARQRLLQQGMSPNTERFAVRQAEMAATLTLKDVGDRVFPHFITKYLPPGLTGLLVAAVFAAAMSTLSTSLNSSATLVMSDFYVRLFRPHAGEQEAMRVLSLATVVWGVLGTGLALGLVSLTDSALDIWWTLAGLFGGGVTGLFLLGMIARRAGNPAAMTGVAAGIVTIAWLSLPTIAGYLRALPDGSALHRFAASMEVSIADWSSPFHSFLIPVFGTLVIVLVGVAVSRTLERLGSYRTLGRTKSS